jgi:hypothetical protein
LDFTFIFFAMRKEWNLDYLHNIRIKIVVQERL